MRTLFGVYERRCHSEAPRGSDAWKGECGRLLLAHDHGTTPGYTAGGAPVVIARPRGGPWWYCPRCDTNGKGCGPCQVALVA